MTQRETAALAFRMFSVYIIYQAIVQLVFYVVPGFFYRQVSAAPGFNMNVLLLVYTAGFLALVGLGVCVWVNSRRLAGLTTGASEDVTVTINLTAVYIESIAFSIVGLYILTQALAELSRSLAGYYLLYQEQGGRVLKVAYREILGSLAAMAIGVGLMLGARGLVNLLHRARRGGGP